MSGHTPGPWREAWSDPWSVQNDRTGNLAWTGIKAGRKVVGMAVTTAAADQAEYHANARLIAAAPDLLEALEAAAGLWAFRSTDDAQRVWLDMTRAAIARATSPESPAQ